MRKTLLVALLVGTLCCSLCVGTNAWAGEVDLLIQKLVEKGLLTKEDAKALLVEMEKEKPKEDAVAKEVAKGKAEEPAKEKTEKAALELPDWLKNTKFSGDFRLRYQGQDQINSSDLETEWRSRGRMRLRLNADTKIADDWKVGFQVATGDDNPRSTNATFDDFFSGKEIRIRKAYGEYRPWEWLKAVGGKFTNPLWQPKDMLWDTDVTPEGLAANLNYALNPKFNLLLNPGFFLLREFSVEEDIYMVPVQLGFKWKMMEGIDLQLTGTYYSFENLKGNAAPSYSSKSNTLVGGAYIYSYDPISASAALEFKLPYRAVPHLAVYGQYINADTNSQDTGYCGGLRFGHRGVKAFGQWVAEFNYRRLERNAWVDFLSDSEFFNGSTNAKGYELELRFGLARGISLKLDWYSMEKIDKFDPALGTIGQDSVLGFTDQDLLQVDLEFKF